MNTLAHFQFLGTGASMGIPVIGCHCHVCNSAILYNKRMRPSALLSVGAKKIVIDCGPDFRLQALKHNLDKIDGVILTHAHQDHTGGLDELRVYFMHHKTSLPSLMSQESFDNLNNRLSYLFQNKVHSNKLVPRLDVHVLDSLRGVTTFAGLKIHYMTYEQAQMGVNGYRFGNLAYVTDICKYQETIFEDLLGVEILIVSALRFLPSPMHFNIDDAVAFANRVGAKQTWLTHIAHEVDHDKANVYLPSNIQVAYDGLELPFYADLDQ